jgi:Zn-dependent protease with chaperone function
MNSNTSTSPDYSILSAIQPIPDPPKTSMLYQFNLLVVAVVMVLLPVIYFALVALAGYGVYYHAAYHSHWLSSYGSRSGRGVFLVFLAYIIPIVVGAVIVFFMIKPIFAGRPKRAQPLALNPADNPLLYAFIEKICETVGAPSPKRIDLDCEVNASAGFRRGLWSMFGNDLVLTIGLPLVANLSAAEFGGVVAHEFGHFTQSVGMRLSYIIRRVNFWFMRVIYERDAWDEMLERWSAEVEDGRVAIIVWTAQIGVFFARSILRVLMYIGLIIGGFMLRQMEYDADAWEIKLAGSENFERTQRKLATLSAASEKMYKQIHAQWKKSQQLPDNISELLRQHHDSLPHEALQKIEDAFGLERTGFFDSHPSFADRIRAARRAQDPGVFHDERPAAELFTSFDHPARFVTLLHYTDDLEIPVTPDMLLAIESTAQSRAGKSSAHKSVSSSANGDALDRYFLGVLPMLEPAQLRPLVPSMNYEDDMAELLQITANLQNVRGHLEPLAGQFADATERLQKTSAAIRLLTAQNIIAPETYGLKEASLEAAQIAEAEASQTRLSLRHSLHEVRSALLRRLELGLTLRLANAGEHSHDEISNAAIAAALKKLETDAAVFSAKQSLADALEIFDRLVRLRQSGDVPANLERAVALQMEVINGLQPGIIGKTSSAPATSQLKLKTLARHADDDFDSTKLQQEVRKWFDDHHANFSFLVQAAESVEDISSSV